MPLDVEVSRCCFRPGEPWIGDELPLVPHVIPAVITGCVTFKQDGIAHVGDFEIMASVFVRPERDILVLVGVGLSTERPHVRLFPPATGQPQVVDLDDMDDDELGLRLTRAINDLWERRKKIGKNSRIVLPLPVAVPFRF
ncbi:MAG: hypothetical protein R3C10_26295 [Pirellulales bacterium]